MYLSGRISGVSFRGAENRGGDRGSVGTASGAMLIVVAGMM